MVATLDASEALTPAWTQFDYHAGQAALWTCSKRFVSVPAGRGSGKTELAKRRLVRYLSVEKPWSDPRYFYGAPTEQQAKRIAWRHLLQLIPKDWIAFNGINRSDLLVTTVFGSSLQLIGLDKPQRIEGVQWDGCVIDESCDIKPGTFHLNVLPTLVWRHGWCWRIGVPKRFGIGATEFRTFHEKAVKGELAEATGFTWPSSEIIPAEALAFAQENMDAIDYKEQFGGIFVSAAGGIFHAFDEEYNVRPCPYHPEMPIIVGSDFNVHPMAWVLCHTYGDRLEVFDMLWLRDANTQHTLDILKTRYGSHTGGFQFFGDATGRARKTSARSSDYAQIQNDSDFKRMGRTIHYLHSDPIQADRFAAMNALICSSTGTRRLFVDPRCKPLIDDIRMRAWKPGTRVAYDIGKDDGHATDALGYIIYRKYPIRVSVGGRYEVAVTGVAV